MSSIAPVKKLFFSFAVNHRKSTFEAFSERYNPATLKPIHFAIPELRFFGEYKEQYINIHQQQLSSRKDSQSSLEWPWIKWEYWFCVICRLSRKKILGEKKKTQSKHVIFLIVESTIRSSPPSGHLHFSIHSSSLCTLSMRLFNSCFPDVRLSSSEKDGKRVRERTLCIDHFGRL